MSEEESKATAGSAEGAEQTAKKPKGPSKFSLLLNKYFHHVDRGGSLGGEVMAGIVGFLIAISLLMVNMQVVCASVLGDITLSSSPANASNIAYALEYAQIYAASVLVAFIGTLVIGLVARLPFIQLSVMGLGTSFLSLLGTGSGLTYYNILFVDFIAAVLYAVIVGVPFIKKAVFNALPKSLRKAIPAVVGSILIVLALQMSGFFTTTEVSTGTVSGLAGLTFTAFSESTRDLTTYAFIGAVVAVAVYFVFRALKFKHPVFWSFIIGTLLFIVIDIINYGFDTSSTEGFINFGRVWVAAGSQSSDTTPFADSYLSYFGDAFSEIFSNIGSVFTEGSDFSAYTGNTVAFIISGIIAFLLLGLYGTQGVMDACESDIKCSDDAKAYDKAFWCNAGMNVVAPLFGVGAVGISTVSVANTKDNGKSGLTSVVASIGFLISLFIIAFPLITATYTYPVTGMNVWNYNAYGNGGMVYLLQSLQFGIADAVLLCVGVSMVATSLKELDWGNATEALSAVVMIVVGLLFANLVYALAAGIIMYTVVKFFSFRKEGEKLFAACKSNFVANVLEIGIPTAVLFVLVIVMAILL